MKWDNFTISSTLEVRWQHMYIISQWQWSLRYWAIHVPCFSKRCCYSMTSRPHLMWGGTVHSPAPSLYVQYSHYNRNQLLASFPGNFKRQVLLWQLSKGFLNCLCIVIAGYEYPSFRFEEIQSPNVGAKTSITDVTVTEHMRVFVQLVKINNSLLLLKWNIYR